MKIQLLLSVLGGMSLLLLLIIRLRLPAFIALLIAAIVTALMAGMETGQIIETVQKGMGSTLGFVATVVGLGAIFGGILEKTGGAEKIATSLLNFFGEKKAPLALLLTGFMVGIPVFFDVGFIILFPMLPAVHQKTKKSLVFYAIPLLAGLAVTHAFIPPTPGPIAVADILGANLGMVIGVGVLAGLPAAYASGLLYGKYIGHKIDIQIPHAPEPVARKSELHTGLVFAILLLPIALILMSTVAKTVYKNENAVTAAIQLLGHPFSALILANILAWYVLGRNYGFSTRQLTEISSKSMQPAGVIILVTGAGGVLKQVLVDTGAGKMIAEAMQDAGLSIIVFSFLAATIVRVLQGSATVAMITAAGLVAPLLASYQLNAVEVAALVTSIASGATMLSHLNDSGFWLVKEFLHLSEKQGLQTWTIASSILGLTGFVMSCLIFWVG
ncbi:MAG TPA: gluconate:H+ symporter [Saprospiraceae bacterium]|nr:gluconate:H+ symporter [Saprospiraceae bacterium]